ncbi:hypothetical protein [Streptomyces sp. NPDC088258]|uniref:hypothetical protein n=1 Tax=Streptomyces sp. NPDC088258 TaxID=3365849 RepID=UPI0038265FB3
MIAHPQVLGESVLVVTAEYDRWADTDGVPARGRLDVLGLDATGHLVVVELKRGTADRNVHLQAITYAALVSRFDLGTLAQAHRDFLSRRGQDLDIAACTQRLLDHVDGEWSPELLQRPPPSDHRRRLPQAGHPLRGLAVGDEPRHRPHPGGPV